jgi:hypothetical protein
MVDVSYRKGVCAKCGALFWHEGGAVRYPIEESVVKLPPTFQPAHSCPSTPSPSPSVVTSK